MCKMSIKDDLNPDNALTDLAMRGSEYNRCLGQKSIGMNLCVKKADDIKRLQQVIVE